MNEEKYSRSVTMICPTCGCDQFAYDGEAELVESMTRASCGRVFGRQELIDENGENLSAHVQEMGEEIVKDAAKEMRASLKKALRGSKTIRFK